MMVGVSSSSASASASMSTSTSTSTLTLTSSKWQRYSPLVDVLAEHNDNDDDNDDNKIIVVVPEDGWYGFCFGRRKQQQQGNDDKNDNTTIITKTSTKKKKNKNKDDEIELLLLSSKYRFSLLVQHDDDTGDNDGEKKKKMHQKQYELPFHVSEEDRRVKGGKGKQQEQEQQQQLAVNNIDIGRLLYLSKNSRVQVVVCTTTTNSKQPGGSDNVSSASTDNSTPTTTATTGTSDNTNIVTFQWKLVCHRMTGKLQQQEQEPPLLSGTLAGGSPNVVVGDNKGDNNDDDDDDNNNTRLMQMYYPNKNKVLICSKCARSFGSINAVTSHIRNCNNILSSKNPKPKQRSSGGSISDAATAAAAAESAATNCEANTEATAAHDTEDIIVIVEGRIIRKKKKGPWVYVFVVPEGTDRSTKICVSQKDFDTRLLVLQMKMRFECSNSSSNSSSSKQQDQLVVKNMVVLESAPDPNAVEYLIDTVPNLNPDIVLSTKEEIEYLRSLRVTRSTTSGGTKVVVPTEGGGDRENKEPPRIIKEKEYFERREIISRIVRRLDGRPDEYHKKRISQPSKIKRSDIQIVEYWEGKGGRGSIASSNDDATGDKSWKLLTPIASDLGVDVGDDENTGSNENNHRNSGTKPIMLNVPSTNNEPASLSHRRIRYLQEKKQPQIQWIVTRLRQLLLSSQDNNNNSNNDDTAPHIIDIGGGRGDLACYIAQCIPNSYVTMIDSNLSSIQAAEQYAKDIQVADRMTFIKDKFENHYQPSVTTTVAAANSGQQQQQITSKRSNVDCVVALHACGDLSDAALAFAKHHRCKCFLVCPCCYTKQYLKGVFDISTDVGGGSSSLSAAPSWWLYHQKQQQQQQASTTLNEKNNNNGGGGHDDDYKVLMRLAETDDAPNDLARRARNIIDSFRVYCCVNTDSSAADSDEYEYDVNLEEYCSTISNRNTVIIGRQLQR